MPHSKTSQKKKKRSNRIAVFTVLFFVNSELIKQSSTNNSNI